MEKDSQIRALSAKEGSSEKLLYPSKGLVARLTAGRLRIKSYRIATIFHVTMFADLHQNTEATRLCASLTTRSCRNYPRRC